MRSAQFTPLQASDRVYLHQSTTQHTTSFYNMFLAKKIPLGLQKGWYNERVNQPFRIFRGISTQNRRMNVFPYGTGIRQSSDEGSSTLSGNPSLPHQPFWGLPRSFLLQPSTCNHVFLLIRFFSGPLPYLAFFSISLELLVPGLLCRSFSWRCWVFIGGNFGVENRYFFLVSGKSYSD